MENLHFNHEGARFDLEYVQFFDSKSVKLAKTGGVQFDLEMV